MKKALGLLLIGWPYAFFASAVCYFSGWRTLAMLIAVFAILVSFSMAAVITYQIGKDLFKE